MKRVRYGKYVPNPADEIDLDDLLQNLSDFLLDSGYRDPWSRFYAMDQDSDFTMENLREAIREALEYMDLPEELREQLQQMGEPQVDDLIDQLMQKMQQENMIREQPDQGNGGDGEGPPARFELTEKGLDFLGYKTLRDLMGSLGKASFGRHETRDLATGVETSGSSRLYEFGDALNLDATATLSAAIRRQGLGGGVIDLETNDLHVHQCEYQSSCATVVMLDCSHSMILYGEDRFTPAKRVAMALSHLVRTQYPGDSLSLVLFHDSAEELPISRLPGVRVGPHHTNTREGLKLAQRILAGQRKDMKQIVMITDGKPSAITLPDGSIYKNAYGLDPMVIAKTLEEVARCRRSNTMINTFMLATDPALVGFVQHVTAMCRGKAYFTTPDRLGEALMMDFMNNRSKLVH